MRIDKASISIWALATSVPFVIGAVMWLTTIYNTGEASAKEIVSLKQSDKEHYEILLKIKEDVAIIKDRVMKDHK